MSEVMDTVHVKSGELVAELQKLNSVSEQGVALDLVQQMMNGIISTYTLARFTVKAFVVQDCYTSNGEKKTLEDVAEVLRLLVKPKSEITGDETVDDDCEKLNSSSDVNDTSVKDELSQALAGYAAEMMEGEKECNSSEEEVEGDVASDRDYEMSEEENLEDDDYKPGAKTRKEVKGAKKRKQGFKVRIRQSRKTAQAVDELNNVNEEELINKVERRKPKKTKRKKIKTERRVSALAKKRRQSDEVIKCATNVHCFICEDESVRYSTEDEFFDHCVKAHVDHSNSDKEMLPCGKCDKSFRVSMVKGAKSYMRTPIYTLLNHLVEKHGVMRPDWVPVYKCKNCSHTTLVRSFLPHHEKTCGQVVPTVTCEFCGMMLKKNSLYLHVKRCSNPGSKVPTFKCDDCGKLYLTQAILDIHVKRMHKKEASHLCTQCTQTFFAKVDLERHMFVHHGVNISRMSVVSCPVCNFQTLEGSLMRKHMKNHDIGSHPCEFCGRIFGTMNRLRMHRLTHTAERKHKCPHCTYTAIRSFHLQRHIAVRHLGSPFKCNRCTFSTTSTNNLRRHMTKSHKYDELTAIEETSNIPTNNVTDELFPTAPRARKRRVNDIETDKTQTVPSNALNDQISSRQNELKEVPSLPVQQLVVAAGVGNNSDNQLQQHIVTVQQHVGQQQRQQQQQVVAATGVEQPSAPSYIQPLFTTPYGMSYHMPVGTQVTTPTAPNAEHTSFLRHVLGQKMSVVPGNMQHEQQQDPNNLYNMHYDTQQHQQQAPVHDQQQQQQPQQQQSYVPQQ